jgi:hypothetical protein
MSVTVTVIQTTCNFFLLLYSSGLGASFFLFTGVFVGSKSSTALLSDHLSILCRLTLNCKLGEVFGTPEGIMSTLESENCREISLS